METKITGSGVELLGTLPFDLTKKEFKKKLIESKYSFINGQSQDNETEQEFMNKVIDGLYKGYKKGKSYGTYSMGCGNSIVWGKYHKFKDNNEITVTIYVARGYEQYEIYL